MHLWRLCVNGAQRVKCFTHWYIVLKPLVSLVVAEKYSTHYVYI